jgi:tetratricopeptide (TPR) repeat protein
MKKLITAIFFVIIATTAFAQRSKVTSAISYKEAGDLKKAFQAIEESIDPTNEKNEKSITWPRTWQVRGQILQEIYRKSATGIVDEPLFKAYESYQKAIELDETSRIVKAITIDFSFLQTELQNYAIVCYENEKYDESLRCFEIYLEINNLPFMKSSTFQEDVDSLIIYNAGLTAYKGKNWDKAIEYFSKTARFNYNGAASYYLVYNAHVAKGDTLNSLVTLKEGFQKYPNDETLLVELINFYISKGKSEDAIIYIEKAIQEKPDNASLYTAKGSMLEKIGKVEDAILMYKKSIEIDDKQFTPYYNMSVIYFNRGVEVINSASSIPPSQTEKYDAEIKKAEEHFRLSLPYIEKAYEIDSSEMAIMESLRTVYYRLQMTEKYTEINKKIQSLKQ